MMEQRKNLNIPISDPARDAFLRSTLISGKLSFEKDRPATLDKITEERPEGVSLFRRELKSALHPNLPAKDLISTIVRTALEVHMGKSFTLVKGFDKMVEKIAAAVMADPTLRRQSLAAVSLVLENKSMHGGNINNG
jgi:hypothetical protein